MRRARKWISGLVVAAVLGLAFWARHHASPTPTLAPPAAATPLSLPHWPVSSALSAVEPQRRLDHSGEIEVCGIGMVKIDQDDWTAPGKYFEALTRKLRMRWLAALRNSDDYRTRATGLYMEGIFDRDAARKDPEAARDELVQLALATQDPAVFALANTKCNKAVEEPAASGVCPQLTLDEWTRADPDNAVPWLQLAAKARKDNNPAAETAAFEHASQAHRYESYNWSMFGFAEPAMPRDITAADRWFLTTEVLGVEAAMPVPYLPMFQYCSREALSDSTVHRQCNALAELIVNKATTLMELSVGKSLGARVGWPAHVLDKLTQQLQASMQAFAQMAPSDPDEQWSCASVERGNAFMSDWERLGERGIANEAIERSGESLSELSHKYSDRLETMRR
jgi:hypothetical protein